jgi:hypothetical protein
MSTASFPSHLYFCIPFLLHSSSCSTKRCKKWRLHRTFIARVYSMASKMSLIPLKVKEVDKWLFQTKLSSKQQSVIHLVWLLAQYRLQSVLQHTPNLKSNLHLLRIHGFISLNRSLSCVQWLNAFSENCGPKWMYKTSSYSDLIISVGSYSRRISYLPGQEWGIRRSRRRERRRSRHCVLVINGSYSLMLQHDSHNDTLNWLFSYCFCPPSRGVQDLYILFYAT